jgi:hypothetical protein
MESDIARRDAIAAAADVANEVFQYIVLSGTSFSATSAALVQHRVITVKTAC